MPSAVRIKTTAGWQDIAVQGPPSGQMQLIYDATLGAAAATIDIPNIPQTFEHLRLEWTARGDHASMYQNVYGRFNGDGAANNNYDIQRTQSTGASVTASEANLASVFDIGLCICASALAGRSGAGVAEIPNYRGTSLNKWVIATGGASAGDSGIWTSNASKWRNTAAINRITLLVSNGDFAAGTRVTLYGILAQPEVAQPAGSMVLIQDALLPANSGTGWDFTSIPQTYNHLKLRATIRTYDATTFSPGRLRFNGDAGANYYNQRMRANGSTLTGYSDQAVDGVIVDCTGDSVSPGIFNAVEVDIPDYRSTTRTKTVMVQNPFMTGGGVGGSFYQANHATWYNTAAINRLQMSCLAKAGSRATLYGII